MGRKLAFDRCLFFHQALYQILSTYIISVFVPSEVQEGNETERLERWSVFDKERIEELLSSRTETNRAS